jgi:predicted O-methyltransferase YrrM
MKEIESKIIIPEHDKYTPVKVEEAQFIHDFISDNNLKRTLEIGLAYGRSAAYIITATGSKHIAIDPFQDKYQNLGIANLENLKLDQYLDFHNDYSHNILPRLMGGGGV